MNIAQTIRQIAAQGRNMACMVCTVDKVDKDARTADCTPLDESAPLLGVNLQANQGSTAGMVAYPRQGSYVVVGFTAAGAAAVVLLADEVESIEATVGDNTALLDDDGITLSCAGNTTAELTRDGITLNGGNLGGLVKVQELTDKLNGLKDTVNNLITSYNAHIHTTTATNIATGSPGIISPTTSQATPANPFVKSDYENQNIKQ